MKCKYILTIMALALLPGVSFAKNTLITPTLTCATSTSSSISITVTAASPYGAPAGFSIQWMTAADFAANGNVWPSDETLFCKASFSGNAYGFNYSLAPGATKTVTLGDTLFDTPGASSPCDGIPLLCGTDYVFRVFAHANSSYNRSAFSSPITCSTLPCVVAGGCTYTQGYWKNHGPAGCDSGNNTDVWPATVVTSGLTLGTVNYTELQLCSILNLPGAGGNGLLTLAHQLIAAKLNIANGADGSAIASTISAADAMIGSLVIPPVNSSMSSLPPSQTNTLTSALTAYNEGTTGPGHCGNEPPQQ
jgi:hypothetical protein